MEQHKRREPSFDSGIIIEGEVLNSKVLPLEEEEPHRWIRAGAIWRLKSWQEAVGLVVHLMLLWVFLFFTLPIIGPPVRALADWLVGPLFHVH